MIALGDLAAEITFTIFGRGMAIVCAAWLLVAALKGASAAVRHGVWVGAFIALAAVPFVRPALSEWSVMLPIPGEPAFHPAAGEIHNAIAENGSAARLHSGSRPDGTGGRSGNEESGQRHRLGSLTAALATLVWLAGAAILVLRVAVDAVRAAALVRRGTPIADDAVTAALRSMGRSNTGVVLSDETDVPLLAGLRRPKVVLPCAAEHWPADLLDSVLSHEVAHADRRDHLSRFLARMVAALYWPNPLVASAARRLSREQERACDDCVLRRRSAVDYAGHMLDIASCRIEGRLLPAAPRMVPAHPLGDRIRDLLSRTADRRPATASSLALPLLTLAAVAAPAATVNLERSATPDPRLFAVLSHETGAFRQHAAWALGEFESPGAVEALLDRIADADPGVRGAVAWALGEIKDPTAVGPLSIMLREDEDPFVREMAALALGEIGAPSAAASLVRALDNDELRPAALWALQEIGDSASTSSRHFGGSESADTRWLDRPEMLLQLTQAIRDAPGHMPDGSLPRIGHLLDVARRRDPAGLGDALEALASDDPLVRSHGALAAGRIGDMSAVPPLLAGLRDPTISVRSMAVWALDEINVSAHGR